jgi:glutaredoxin
MTEPAPDPRITLYTKPGCHLCESVEQVIRQVMRRRALALEKVDILKDAGAFSRYQFEIPVVLLDGREIARHRLTVAELEAALSPPHR